MTVSRARIRPVLPVPEKRLRPTQGRAKPKPTSQTEFLRSLQVIQRLSLSITLLLTGGVFIAYSWSIHAQKKWDQQYGKLESLKQLEGRLINASEALDHDRLQNAWQHNNNLVRETPDRTIFLETMPARPQVTPETKPEQAESQLPIAY